MSQITWKLKSISNENESTWEIGNTIDRIGEVYYKTDLIVEIGKVLKAGIKPENIFILDKSFSANLKYINLADNNHRNLGYIYTVGLPTSMFPCEINNNFRFVLKYCRKINQILKKSRLKLIGRATIGELALSVLNDTPLDSVVDRIGNIVNNNYSQSKNKNKIKLANLKKNVNKELETLKEKSRLINIEISNAIDLREQIDEGAQIFDKSDQILVDKYFSKFFYYFEKVSRPFVFYWDEEYQKIKPLGINHINSRKRSGTFLETKSISRNSPLEYIFGGNLVITGITAYSMIKDELRKEELHKQQIISNNLDIEMKQLEILEKKIELYTKYLDFCEKHGDNVINLEDISPFIKNKLLDSNQNNQTKFGTIANYNIMGITIQLDNKDIFNKLG